MKSFWEEQKLQEVFKTYPGEGWLDPGKRPKLKSLQKNIVWKSEVQHWDSEVRSDDTRMIIVDTKKGGKERFQMYAVSEKSKEVIFHWGGKKSFADANEFRIIRHWKEQR